MVEGNTTQEEGEPLTDGEEVEVVKAEEGNVDAVQDVSPEQNEFCNENLSSEAEENKESDTIHALEACIVKLEQENEKLIEEKKSMQDESLRSMAETENYKKRLQREKDDLIKFANESFVKDLIVTIDHFDKAMEAVSSADNMESIREGIDLIYTEFKEVMKKNGVSDIVAVGENFDPNLHEAVAKLPSEEKENKIVQEFRKGYRLNERVLRAAMVAVSTGKTEEKPEPKE